MANNVQIGGAGTLFVGEDKTLQFECIDVNDAPVDIALWAMLFDVRKNDASNPPAILSKTPSLSGIFNPVRNLNTQRAIVVLTDDDTNLFAKAGTWRYSWKRMDADNETVLAWGDFVLEKATAP